VLNDKLPEGWLLVTQLVIHDSSFYFGQGFPPLSYAAQFQRDADHFLKPVSFFLKRKCLLDEQQTFTLWTESESYETHFIWAI